MYNKIIYICLCTFLLAFDQSEIKNVSVPNQKIFDEIFIWSGNSNVFPAIISHEQADKIFRHTQVKKKQKLREIIKG